MQPKKKKKEIDNYKKNLIEAHIFFPGPCKGTFILPPQGCKIWEKIKKILDKDFFSLGVQNVMLPTFIPLELIKKEEEHIKGFDPELFFVNKKHLSLKKKENEKKYVLRPTSETLFYNWYKETIFSYKQLPIMHNQWCSVFRAEKNVFPFLRNTEFFWQEGHTLHKNSEEAKELTKKIFSIYKKYAKKTLILATFCGRKSTKEKFPGALETYTIECLLKDGQCLQIATTHYFGSEFCKKIGVTFLNDKNKIYNPFSTSWGTSTRAIGAIAKTHYDNFGIILPFNLAPIKIAFIFIKKTKKTEDYFKEITSMIKNTYKWKVYDEKTQISQNLLQSDAEGCPIKIVIGNYEVDNKRITIIRRDQKKKSLDLEFNNTIKKKSFILELKKQIIEFEKDLFLKNKDFLKKNTHKIKKYTELLKKINEKKLGIFVISFCNKLKCEKLIKIKIPSYSIRCILEKKTKTKKCVFCNSPTDIRAYLGRSY